MPDVKPPIDDDDDYELELEPVDPEILRLERERAQLRTESAVKRIDINEVYGDTSQYSDLEVDLSGLRQFRFTTQHLLILTAVLALVLTLYQLTGGVKTVVSVAAVLLAGGWWWASRLERQQEAERERRRAEFHGEQVAPLDDDALGSERAPRSSFKFAFSTKELLLTTTAAAVTVALLRWIGPEALSMTLGFVALGGLAAYAIGFDPPRQVVLGWWILLVMYLAVGVLAMAGSNANAARRSWQQADRLAEIQLRCTALSREAVA
jgi:hypothetical protein